MSKNTDRQILNTLVSEGIINREERDFLIKDTEKKNISVEKLLKERGKVDEEKLAEIKGKVFNLSYTNLVGKEIDHLVLGIMPKNIARNYQMIAFKRDNKTVKVALVDPANFQAMEAMDFLAEENGFKVEYYVISEASFKDAIRKYETIGKEVERALGAAKERFGQLPETKELEDIPEEMEIEEVIKRAPVAQIVSVIIKHAVEGGASDIHIEPGREETRVRYRIDGILHTTLKLPIYVHSALIARIKVMANLRLDETRVPQDGRIRLHINDRDIDFRVSTIPVVDNEKVVMRILETKSKAAALSELGFHDWVIKVIERNIKKPNGMFLITGPTGSGKSTTLYTVLSMLNSDGINISTLEDPVEYFIKGVNQSQVNSEVGFTFATGLRALLRQDPNVIMVGEIRDGETGELAIHAGLTGHLIFSTIHTRDSFGVVPRLIDMKLEPFLIASTLNVVVAQRLVRKICNNCKIEDSSIPDDLREKFKNQLQALPEKFLPESIDLNKISFYKGKGCNRCGDSGYKGRSVIAEILEVSREMQKIIVNGCKDADMRAETAKQGMIPMHTDALIKALEGVTTVDEVLRVAQEQ